MGPSTTPARGSTATPPDRECLDADSLRIYKLPGQCLDGQCVYDHEEVSCPDGCDNGGCLGDPCRGIDCDTPPDPQCLDAGRLRVYKLPGQCLDGQCVYDHEEVSCPDGCDHGGCLGDPCRDKICNTPPNECYQPSGTCDNGVCQYAYRDGIECSDSDPCTINDACSSGRCVGQPMQCDTPPDRECLDADRLRVYKLPGQCLDGQCVYDHEDLDCPWGCANGGCREEPCRPHDSYRCDDGDVYWFDSCGNREERKEVCAEGCTGSECDCAAGLVRCGQACVDPATNKDHCGGCDRVCAGTFAGDTARCSSGRCFVTRELYPGAAVTTRLAIDTTSVYWFENDTPVGNSQRHRIMRGPKTGGSPMVVAGQIEYTPSGLVVQNTNVYWTQGNSIWKASGFGGAATRLSSDGHLMLAADTQSLYFFTGAGSNWVLEKMPLAGGVPTALAGVPGAPSAISVDSTNVYWTSGTSFSTGGTKVWQVSKGGGAPILLSGDEDSALSLIPHSGYLYWANYLSEGSIKRVSVGGGNVQTLAPGHGNPTAMAAYGDHVYWVGYTAGLYRIAVAAGPETGMGNGYASAIQVDASGVYWYCGYPHSRTGSVRFTTEVTLR